MDNRKHHYGWDRIHWEDDVLYFQDQWLVKLIPSQKYEKHYHLQFHWRNEPTPEFFNKQNAMENAGIYSLHRLNRDTWQKPSVGPLDALNRQQAG